MDTLESSPHPSILRLIGMLTMVGAGLTTVGLISLLVGADGRGNTGVIAAACLIPGVLLLLVGIAGLHLRQRHASGKMGVIGIGLMFLGIALVATAYLALYGAVLSFVGAIFFSVATVRTAVFPKAPALLLLACLTTGLPCAVLAGYMLEQADIDGAYMTVAYGLLLQIPLAWLGYALWVGRAKVYGSAVAIRPAESRDPTSR